VGFARFNSGACTIPQLGGMYRKGYEDMSDAGEYAASIAKTIREDCESGHPFGIIGDEYGGDGEPGDERTAHDYLEDALDIEYTSTYSGDYLGARIAVTLGGPNAWIDTRERVLSVYWGSDVARESLPASFTNALDDALADVWGEGR
jgi:hypothetical protein